MTLQRVPLALALLAAPGCAAAPRTPAQAPAPQQVQQQVQVAAPAATHSLEIKYFRDSEEYATLMRQVYRDAERAVAQAQANAQANAQSQTRASAWAVVLDVDETALDNSVYQLERVAYGLPFDDPSWLAWVRRGEATALPGVVDFVAAVRKLGGRIAWISNRPEAGRDATRENLRRVGLFADGDRLCLMTADTAYTKARRRAEVRSGAGACGWPGDSVSVAAYVGDALGDFPRAGEADADAASDASREAAFGTRYFILPNPLYGGWTTRVTRLPR